MIQIAICENNQNDMDTITSVLQSCPSSSEFEYIKYDNGASLQEDLPNHQYDIYIFDIELGIDQNGLYYAQLVRNTYPDAVIFYVSNHDRYARYGYMTGAVRFVYKPNIHRELLEAMGFALDIVQKRRQYITFSFNGKTTDCRVSSILYVQKVSRHIEIVHTGGDPISSTIPLHGFYDMVSPQQFIYICKGIIVNLQHVRLLQENDLFMDTLEHPLYVSRRYLLSLRSAIANLLAYTE